MQKAPRHQAVGARDGDASVPVRRSGRDPLALAVFAIAVLALLAGIALGLRELWSPSKAGPGAGPVSGLGAVRSAVVSLFKGEAAPPPSTGPAPSGAKAAATAPAAAPRPREPGTPVAAFPPVQPPDYAAEATLLPPGGRWSYRIGFGAAQSPAGSLNYEVVSVGDQAGPRLRMQWAPNGGSATTWDFGVFAAGHASHANVRFPGFFMHAAYMPHPLQAGQRFTWAFPWQGGEGGARRERRFTATVAGWESVSVPAGRFDAARIDAVLRYIADGKVQAEVRNTLWYAPAARQLVRVQWSGKAPDEGNTDILAELASLRIR